MAGDERQHDCPYAYKLGEMSGFIETAAVALKDINFKIGKLFDGQGAIGTEVTEMKVEVQNLKRAVFNGTGKGTRPGPQGGRALHASPLREGAEGLRRAGFLTISLPAKTVLRWLVPAVGGISLFEGLAELLKIIGK